MGQGCGKPSAAPMTTIVTGVEFNVIAREWRCKWSEDNDKKSLQELQALAASDEVKGALQTLPGVESVHRIVCGGCHDFKIITAIAADQFPGWEGTKFAPEESTLEKMKAIAGVTDVETQTYTWMPAAGDVSNAQCSDESVKITEGVEFNVIGREYRCKWAEDNDKKSLAELQKVANEFVPKLAAIEGVLGVQRIVCGGCHDFKIITAIQVSKHGAWEQGGYDPGTAIKAAMTAIEGVTVVEEQTYTLMRL